MLERILEKTIGRFTVIVDAVPENMPVADAYDSTVYDVERLERQVRRGEKVWCGLEAKVFVRVPKRGHRAAHRRVIGSEHIGGFLGDSFSELRDYDYTRDIVHGAIEDARQFMDAIRGPEREALRYVQVALANWRDCVDLDPDNLTEAHVRHPEHGPLNLEEVKYCLVDPVVRDPLPDRT